MCGNKVVKRADDASVERQSENYATNNPNGVRNNEEESVMKVHPSNELVMCPKPDNLKEPES